MDGKQFDGDYTPEEAAQRRDEVIRRMANTPPQPKIKTPNRRPGKRKPTGADRAARNAASAGKAL